MAGVVYRFDNGPVLRHMGRLALLGRQHFAAARREIGETMLGNVQDALHEQKLFDGAPMPQSKAAIARKGKTLIAKGHLRDSYVYQLTADGVEVGSNKVYAAIHHFGGKTGRGLRVTLPARPVLGLTEATERQIGDYLVAEIQRAQA